MAKKILFRILTLAVCTVMLFSSAVITSNAAEKATKQSFVSRLDFGYDDSDTVRAIVVFKGESGIDLKQKGVSDAKTASKAVAKKRSALIKSLESNYNASVIYSYSTLLNGVAVDVSYGNLKNIEQLDCIEKVYIANRYSAPIAEVSIKPAMVSAGQSVGFTAGTDGGKGTVIAVLDTGLSANHEAFSTMYMGDTVALTQNTVNALKAEKELMGSYLNKKIPYVYDYAENDTNVSSTDYHGTAVASIAAGNNGVDFTGIAPEAQILGMKIFSSDGYTDSTIYFAAMEEAYLLGADVINMSLGSQNGFSFDYELETVLFGNIFEKLKEEGIFVCCAAGNEYSQGYWEYSYNHASSLYYIDAVTADYADYGVIGNPASYSNAIAVGSGNNSSYAAYTLNVNGTDIEYNEAVEGSFFSAFAGQTLEYVMIPGVGAVEDYIGINATGKVAVVSRGEITFTDKCIAAANAGAVAMICYNNTSGNIYMDITSPAIPCVSVAGNAYESFAANSSLTVNTEASLYPSPYGVQMSSFSSWGVTPDLKLKPEITAIGGSVLCASMGLSGYTYMDGTSMSTPMMSGIFACLKGDIASKNLEGYSTDKEIYELIYDTVLSSAELLYNDEGLPYSPRQQGAGLPVYANLKTLNAAFEEPIVNLGDDPETDGVYAFTTTVKNLYGGATSFSVGDTYVLCDKHELIDGVYYNTLTSYAINANIKVNLSDGSFNDGVYYFEEGTDAVDITVTISLSDEAKEYLSVYTNGGYIEGYLFLNINGGIQQIKQTFMGFYGDWTSAPAFEAYDWGDVVDVKAELSRQNVSDLDYTTVLNTNVGYNEAYLNYGTEIVGILGDNLYGWVDYSYDRMAFPTAQNTGKCLADSFSIYPSLLRNVRHIVMTVSNAETGEVYYVDDTEYGIKNFFDLTESTFLQGTYFTWDGSYYDGHGNFLYVEDGTKVKITFQTQLDYEGAKLVTEREYYVSIDNSAPEFEYKWNADSKTLTVRAIDEQYISNIFVFSGDYETTHSRLDITDSVPGEYKEWIIDLSDTEIANFSEFCLEVQDYATNYDNVWIETSVSSGNLNVADHLKGDVNLDGTVDSLDAAYALRYDVGIIEITDEQRLTGDVNASGTVDNLDAAVILRYDAFGYWPRLN